MGRPYITLWSRPHLEAQRRAADGNALHFVANDQFTSVGVRPGDRITSSPSSGDGSSCWGG